MAVTSATEIYDSFESSFQDKVIIPEELEKVWLLKAIGQFSVEVGPLDFDEENMQFSDKLDRYTIDCLGLYMKLYYQERQVSKVNKRATIVSKDFSYDGSASTKTSEEKHLVYIRTQLREVLDNLKPTAYV